MSLDYTAGCVNFRDVGEFVNLILNKEQLPVNRLYRGGSIDYVSKLIDIKNVRSIINLRNGPDPILVEADYYHFPMANKIEKYDTGQKEVRNWLNQIIGLFTDSGLKYPVLIHCLSGKDRTGIVIGALLKIIGVEESVIIEEYLLSDGEVHEQRIRQALDGMNKLDDYFNRVDLDEVRKNIYKVNFDFLHDSPFNKTST